MNESERDSYRTYAENLKNFEFIELKRNREETSRSKKFKQSRVMFKYEWAQFKNNAYYGGLSGGALGLVLGIPLFIKTKQISTLIISVVMTGGFFATIGGIGAIMRHEDLELAQGRMNDTGFVGSDF